MSLDRSSSPEARPACRRPHSSAVAENSAQSLSLSWTLYWKFSISRRQNPGLQAWPPRVHPQGASCSQARGWHDVSALEESGGGAGAPCCALRVGTHSPRLPAAPRCCLCDVALGASLLRAALRQRRALRTLRLVFEPPHLGPPPPSSELRASSRASLTPWPSPTEAGLSQETHFKSHAQGSAHPAVVSSACPSCPRQQLAVGEGPQRPAGDQPALMTFPLPRLGQAAGLPLSSWGSHCCWSGCTRAARGAWPCHTCAGGHRTEVPPKPRVCGPDQPCLAAEAIPPACLSEPRRPSSRAAHLSAPEGLPWASSQLLPDTGVGGHAGQSRPEREVPQGPDPLTLPSPLALGKVPVGAVTFGTPSQGKEGLTRPYLCSCC